MPTMNVNAAGVANLVIEMSAAVHPVAPPARVAGYNVNAFLSLPAKKSNQVLSMSRVHLSHGAFPECLRRLRAAGVPVLTHRPHPVKHDGGWTMAPNGDFSRRIGSVISDPALLRLGDGLSAAARIAWSPQGGLEALTLTLTVTDDERSSLLGSSVRWGAEG